MSVIFAFFLSSGTRVVAHLLLQFLHLVTQGCDQGTEEAPVALAPGEATILSPAPDLDRGVLPTRDLLCATDACTSK